MNPRIKRLCGVALLLLVAAGLAGCGATGFQACDGVAPSGPCSVGRHHDNSA
jgi:hypothetical protein